MFNLEHFLYMMYTNRYEQDSDMYTAISLSGKFLTNKGCIIKPDDAKALEKISHDDSRLLATKLVDKDGHSIVLKIGEYSVVAHGYNFLIDFSTGVMRIPTNDGYVYLPSFDDDGVMYFSKGSIAYFEAVLSNAFASPDVSDYDINKILPYIKPDEVIPLEDLEPFEEVINSVLDYAERKKTEEVKEQSKDSPKV